MSCFRLFKKSQHTCKSFFVCCYLQNNIAPILSSNYLPLLRENYVLFLPKSQHRRASTIFTEFVYWGRQFAVFRISFFNHNLIFCISSLLLVNLTNLLKEVSGCPNVSAALLTTPSEAQNQSNHLKKRQVLTPPRTRLTKWSKEQKRTTCSVTSTSLLFLSSCPTKAIKTRTLKMLTEST